MRCTVERARCHRKWIERADFALEVCGGGATNRATPPLCSTSLRTSRLRLAVSPTTDRCCAARRQSDLRPDAPASTSGLRSFHRARSKSLRHSIGPVSRPASICMIVMPVSLVARLDRARDRRRAAPARQQRCMNVQRRKLRQSDPTAQPTRNVEHLLAAGSAHRRPRQAHPDRPLQAGPALPGPSSPLRSDTGVSTSIP